MWEAHPLCGSRRTAQVALQRELRTFLHGWHCRDLTGPPAAQRPTSGKSRLARFLHQIQDQVSEEKEGGHQVSESQRSKKQVSHILR